MQEFRRANLNRGQSGINLIRTDNNPERYAFAFQIQSGRFRAVFPRSDGGAAAQLVRPGADRSAFHRVAFLPDGGPVPDLDVRQAGDPQSCAWVSGGQHRQPLLRRYRQDPGGRGVRADAERQGAEGGDFEPRLSQPETFAGVEAHAYVSFAEDRGAAEGGFRREGSAAGIGFCRRRTLHARLEPARRRSAGGQGPGQVRTLRRGPFPYRCDHSG